MVNSRDMVPASARLVELSYVAPAWPLLSKRTWDTGMPEVVW